MWYLEHVSARDICSFHELEYSPARGTTTLVFGRNADNDNQRSNGSGKSTLVEAIAFGITGAPLRRVRSEEIINDGAEACRVALRFGNTATGEGLAVEREIFRKGTSSVKCLAGMAGALEAVALESVEAANRYILERLGITRDELFFAFILSRHRYEDFLSSSDREKKEIINRFSNGIVVDRAIEHVEADLAPLGEALREADLEIASLDGRIEMLAEQIHTEEETRTEKERSRQEKIDGISAGIAAKRETIRSEKELIAAKREFCGHLSGIDERMQEVENSDEPLAGCMARVRELLAPVPGTKLTDWSKVSQIKEHQIAEARAEIDKWTKIIAMTGEKLARAASDFEALKSEHAQFEAAAAEKDTVLAAQMQELEERLGSATARIGELQRRKRTLSAGIEALLARLAGTVECPACAHRFLVSDRTFDVAAAQAELAQKESEVAGVKKCLLDDEAEAGKVEQMITAVRGEVRTLAANRHGWEERMAKGKRAVEAAEYEMEGARFNIGRVRDYVAARTHEVEDMRRSLFDEAYDALDAARGSAERESTLARERIAAAESSIDTLEQTLTELEKTTTGEFIASLRTSLKEYRRKETEIVERRRELSGRIAALQAQQQTFVLFRTYLANTKIEALAGMLNKVLEDLGSDLRVNLSGYTQLKSGAVREKISVSILRDGMDAGAFAKFSEGERARVNLASIVAMQRLINGNCDFGKGLDLLCIDEVIDAMDADGLASVFAALNRLEATALVVSHGLVQENYPHRITVVKENGESRIEQR